MSREELADSIEANPAGVLYRALLMTREEGNGNGITSDGGGGIAQLEAEGEAGVEDAGVQRGNEKGSLALGEGNEGERDQKVG
jgi:hypothetical protein